MGSIETEIVIDMKMKMVTVYLRYCKINLNISINKIHFEINVLQNQVPHSSGKVVGYDDYDALIVARANINKSNKNPIPIKLQEKKSLK